MPKRKRPGSLSDPRPNKKRKKNVNLSPSPLPINRSGIFDPNTNKSRSMKKQIIPKSAFKLLSDPLDHVLFFNLLSKMKRPQTRLEWDLMSLAFIDNGSETISGDTLHDFYADIVESGCINDAEFLLDDDDEDGEYDDIMYHINFASKQYQNALYTFMDNVCAFMDTQCIDVYIFGKRVDLFYLYILVTKRGGFDAVNANDKWMNILHEMATHFNAHHLYEGIEQMKTVYNEYLYPYQQVYFDEESIDCIDDDFGDDLYLEYDNDIINVLTQYPLKTETEIDLNDNDECYWLDITPNGHHFGSLMFEQSDICIKKENKHNICVSESEWKRLLSSMYIDDDDDEDESERKRRDIYDDDLIELHDDEYKIDYVANGDFYVCNIKGMHPYTRKLIDYMLSECDSDISLMEMEGNNHNGNQRKSSVSLADCLKLREYEIDYIVNELILKMLRLLCGLNNSETSMIYAFWIGLNVLRKEYVCDENGYLFYKNAHYIYYKRIIAPFESFVRSAMKMAHNFLSHPVGYGVIHVSLRSELLPIKKGTFLSSICGDFYSVSRWIEHAFCVDNLYHSLLSGWRLNELNSLNPVLIEYFDCNSEYRLLGLVNNNRNWTQYLNHSCCPNCVIKPFIASNSKNKMIKLGLFALTEISRGDELSVDYGLFSTNSLICSESICLCGARLCRSSFIGFRDASIENCYLNSIESHHSYMDRFVALLSSSLSPLTSSELDGIHDMMGMDDDAHHARDWGDWMFKYIAFLCEFISSERSNLSHLLLSRIHNCQYTLADAERDVSHRLYLSRLRCLSICISRVGYFLWRQPHTLYSSSGDALFIPPLRFAEIDFIISRLWNDSDSLIHRLLHCLSQQISSDLYSIMESMICRTGLMEESQYGLYLIRCKFIEIAQILSAMKCSKTNRHFAAADILYLYANTYRFVVCSEYVSFASSWADCAVISNYRDIKKCDSRYLTRSEMHKTNTNHFSSNAPKLTEKERFIYSSSFALISLLSWHLHDCGEDIEDEIKSQYEEYQSGAPGTLLLPDIESCYDENCKGLYMMTHRNYLFKCLLQRKCWMKASYTKQYEHQHDSNLINSCPVPQFTFQNKLRLFGSPVLDSFLNGFNNKNNKYIQKIVNGMKNNYNFKPHK